MKLHYYVDNNSGPKKVTMMTTLLLAVTSAAHASASSSEAPMSHLVQFQHSAQRHLEAQVGHLTQTINEEQHRRQRRHLQTGGQMPTVCTFLLPIFDYSMQDDPEFSDGVCTCTGTLDTSLEIECSFTDVCDDNNLWLGNPTCASTVTVGYTLSGLFDGGVGDTATARQEGGDGGFSFDYSISSNACVDMSNPDLPEYCMTFNFALSGDFAQGTDSSLQIVESCETTLSGDDCICEINVDVDVPEQSCLTVDCSGVSEDWPPMEEGDRTKCLNPLEIDDGGSIETSSFLLAFDDSEAKAADTQNNGSPAPDRKNTVLLFTMASAAAALWTMI